MAAIDITILQKRVETLISRVEIMGQDVATLRQRVEEVNAHVELELEKFQAHADERFTGLEQQVRELSQKLDLDRASNDAGFRSVLEAIDALRPSALVAGMEPKP